MPDARIEFVAQVIHAYKHLMGTADICGTCREVATGIVLGLEARSAE